MQKLLITLDCGHYAQVSLRGTSARSIDKSIAQARKGWCVACVSKPQVDEWEDFEFSDCDCHGCGCCCCMQCCTGQCREPYLEPEYVRLYAEQGILLPHECAPERWWAVRELPGWDCRMCGLWNWNIA